MYKTLALSLALLLVAPLASAQVPGLPFSVYAGGGLDIPSQPDTFSDQFKTGYHGLVAVGFDWLPTIQIVGKIELHSLPGEDDAITYTDPFGDPIEYEPPDLTIWMFGGDLRGAFGAPGMSAKPFVLAGAGVARLDQNEIDSIDDIEIGTPWEGDTKIYWNIGAGLEIGTTAKLFAQVRYVRILTDEDDTSIIPITVGLRFF
jgi:opacity protein-like surface antigen